MHLKESYGVALVTALKIMQVDHQLAPTAFTGSTRAEAVDQLGQIPGLTAETASATIIKLRFGIIDASVQQDGSRGTRVEILGRRIPDSSHCRKVFEASCDVLDGTNQVVGKWRNQPSKESQAGLSPEEQAQIIAAARVINGYVAPAGRDRKQGPTADLSQYAAQY